MSRYETKSGLSCGLNSYRVMMIDDQWMMWQPLAGGQTIRKTEDSHMLPGDVGQLSGKGLQGRVVRGQEGDNTNLAKDTLMNSRDQSCNRWLLFYQMRLDNDLVWEGISTVLRLCTSGMGISEDLAIVGCEWMPREEARSPWRCHWSSSIARKGQRTSLQPKGGEYDLHERFAN